MIDLEKLAELAQQATSAPWVQAKWDKWTLVDDICGDKIISTYDLRVRDFCAAARAAMPAMIEELRAARLRIAKLEKIVREATAAATMSHDDPEAWKPFWKAIEGLATP